MYRNLNAEMARVNIKVADLAKAIGMHERALYRRLNGDTPFSIKECVTIRNVINPSLTLDYLFECEDGELNDR